MEPSSFSANEGHLAAVEAEKPRGERASPLTSIRAKVEMLPDLPIPRRQVARLQQRAGAVNRLYRSDSNGVYRRCIVIHVDSRSRSRGIDVFFYHHARSRKNGAGPREEESESPGPAIELPPVPRLR